MPGPRMKVAGDRHLKVDRHCAKEFREATRVVAPSPNDVAFAVDKKRFEGPPPGFAPHTGRRRLGRRDGHDVLLEAAE